MTRSRSLSRTVSRQLPSQLAISPTLRPSPSLFNLNIHSQDTASLKPKVMQSADYLLDSSASSVIDMDPGEGILVQDIDTEANQTDTEDIESIDQAYVSTSSDGQKQLLRDQLRSLSHRAVQSGPQLDL